MRTKKKKVQLFSSIYSKIYNKSKEDLSKTCKNVLNLIELIKKAQLQFNNQIL